MLGNVLLLLFDVRASVKKLLQSEFFGVAQNWLHCAAAAAAAVFQMSLLCVIVICM